MIVSSSSNEYRLSTAPPSVMMRSRSLKICEPAFPSRDYARQENYVRRQAQQLQGWACPRTIPYQGIEPVRLSPRPPKPITTERLSAAPSEKAASKTSASSTTSSRPKSSSVVQDEPSIKLQNEATLRRLKSVQLQYMKKTSDILRSVQLGHSVKDVLEKLSQTDGGRIEPVDVNKPISIAGDEKEQEALYDRLVEDFYEDDEADASSVTGIRDDIMSPRTVVKGDSMETNDSHKFRPAEFTTHPVKLCHSAPLLNRKNYKQAIYRPFTPRYNSLSARLRLQSRMPYRDPLYRQLCCILWLLRAMCRPLDQRKRLSGCWNIDQWQERSKTSSRSHANSPDMKPASRSHPVSDNSMTLDPLFAMLTEDSEKASTVDELRMSFLPQASIDSQTVISAQSDGGEHFSFPIASVSVERDLNEPMSTRSHQDDVNRSINLASSQHTGNISSSAATSVVSATDSSDISLPPKPSTAPQISAKQKLKESRERRYEPKALLKKWIKQHTITDKDTKKPLSFPEKDLRQLRVGDKADLTRIFGLENATSTHREQAKARETRQIEQKLGVNISRRSASSAGSDRSKKHAETLASRRREFEEFTEEQTTILNNKLQRVDNNRLFYYQTKLNDMQKLMPTCTLSDHLLRKLRFDKDEQKQNAFYLRYQSWYIDLLEMVQPEYLKDQLIPCLLKELKEYADPMHTPTEIGFKKILRELAAHEICHPDIMAAIEFARIHIVKMAADEFDRFFCKQFPEAAKFVTPEEPTEVEDNEETISD